MSDSALSQDELDALLAGSDTGTVAAGGSEEYRKAFEGFLSSSVGGLSANFAQLTAEGASLKGPEVTFSNRDTLVEELADTITVVKADFNSGFPGEHMFVMAEDTAKAIVGLMTHDEAATLDEANLSAISEMISNLVGTQITALTKQTGNKSIASVSPEATNVPKALAALPGGDFLNAVYQLDLGDGNARQCWEIYGPSVTEDIARALSGDKEKKAPPPRSGNGAQAMGGGMSAMGAMNGSGQATNVQSVQFPNLVPHATAQEQGNIGLIMDVYMEMTVELGRTRKLIKEILGMGEGTVIELDKLAGEPVDILVNHKLIAKGEVVVIDENFGVRVTEIVSPQERARDMGSL
ncbi:MAG: flagellar motor switch protein FliN [Treponema sp.]|jgi:flagellar motor switch protein FliN/FliY|nr:flagellar motor switch protein FliN [Treponema sp.]